MHFNFYLILGMNLQFFKTSFSNHDNLYGIDVWHNKNNELNPTIVPHMDFEDHLSRKKRYLEFPEGSSFQIVYDLIVGVVDYTNYLILGVTVALSWELPTKPPSEILDDLKERLKSGTLGLRRNDTIQSNIYNNNSTVLNLSNNHWQMKPFNRYYKYTHFPPTFQPPMHSKYLLNTSKSNYNVYKKYYHKTPKINPVWNKVDNSHQHPTNHIKYPWWNLPSRLKGTARKHNLVNNSGYMKKPVYSRGHSIKHKILPIFGKKNSALHSRHKRSGINSPALSKWDHIHIRYQRSTRHSLYESIEKYLKGRGSSGHHCVLRALCETGQKAGDRKPGSFVGEIMRAVFTMPEPLEADVSSNRLTYMEQRYDTAHNLKGDCSARYHLCKDSLWSSHLVA